MSFSKAFQVISSLTNLLNEIKWDLRYVNIDQHEKKKKKKYFNVAFEFKVHLVYIFLYGFPLPVFSLSIVDIQLQIWRTQVWKHRHFKIDRFKCTSMQSIFAKPHLWRYSLWRTVQNTALLLSTILVITTYRKFTF